MLNFFKRKKKINQASYAGFFSKAFRSLQIRFATFMSRHEKKYTNTQKRLLLGSFCFLIVTLHSINIYRAMRPSPTTQKPPTRQSITTPEDISVPDSLDLQLIRKYRELKTKQDSISTQ